MQQSTCFQLLEPSISAERLAPYRLYPADTEIDVYARYFWNVALSEAFYPTLKYLEVALRNNINAAATNAFNNPMWFDTILPNGTHLLTPNECKRVYEAKNELTKDGKAHDPGRIVASLSFGFWTSLFRSPYEQVLWPRLTKVVLPYAPRKIRYRNALARHFDYIRKLRNRVFHHEPIWNRPYLLKEHDTVLDTVGWLNPTMEAIIPVYDRFPEVYLRGIAPYHVKLTEFYSNLPQ